QAALSASLELIDEVGRLASTVSSTQLSLGVGLATGDVFVGNIRAIDRWIWSAIGRTTNLASRLQSMTRSLGASVVIDSTTGKRGQAHSHGFQRLENLPVRGFEDPVGVFLLPGLRANPVPEADVRLISQC
ncbi:MAG: adenylate/guanylate cyclase domain-containing protein, partial [Deltaproteobacteria bacterium]|nr:adenylate/guanylate cyclase domain-containing protein [Deltaproteobacteria bacterium]